MYTQQDRFEEQLRKLGITDEDAYSCTCYVDQMGNKPKKGDVLSWAESSRRRVRELCTRRALQP